MSYIDELNSKRQTTAQNHKEQSELQAMLAELKKMQMASLMGSQGKSTVILTDQTDLGDKLRQMVASFAQTVKTTDTTGLNKEQLTELKALQTGLERLTAAVKASKPDNSDIIRAVQALKLDTVVNVPEPQVNVNVPKVDFSPLQKTIRDTFKWPEQHQPDATPDRYDLSRYRAQDLKDGDDIQYVGMMNPEGDWYIIENKVKENSMRYVFGTGNYSRHFANAEQYEYRLLGNAVNG